MIACKPKLLVFVACIVSSGMASAQDTYVKTKELVRAFYPEMKDRNVHATIRDDLPFDASGGLTSFVLNLKSPPQQAINSTAELTVAAVYSRDAKLKLCTFSGTASMEQENTELRALVDSHPDWSDEQVVQAIKSAGAKFGPMEQRSFAKWDPTKNLPPSFGKVRIMSAKFDIRDPMQLKEKLPAAELHWSVKIESRSGTAPAQTYYMILEPFEGKLVQLGKIGN